MSKTFPVKWKRMFKKLAIFLSIAIDIPVVLIMLFRYISSDFNYDKTFEHVSLPLSLFILFIGVPLSSVLIAFIVSQYFRIANIQISDGKITGRNYWMFKNSIPLSDITMLTNFSSNGINAIVVNSKYHGKVYISEHTDCLSELLKILEPYLTQEESLNS